MRVWTLLLILVPGALLAQQSNGRAYAGPSLSNGLHYGLAGAEENGRNYQRPTYPAGTLFQESFGNLSSGDACWSGGPTTCYQTWAVQSGSGAVLTTKAGFAGTVLELPPGSNTPTVYSYGTFPLVPQSQGAVYDLTFLFEYTSTSGVGYSTWFSLGTPTGQSQALNFVYAGSGNAALYLNTAGSIPAAPNVVHTIHVHIAGAASYGQIDGGAENGFTAPASDWMEITLYGNSGSATEYFGPITITSPALTGGWPASVVMDWRNGSGAPTAASLGAGTECGNGSWSQFASGSLTFGFDNTVFAPLPYPAGACGLGYSGETGVGVKATWTSSSASNYWEYNWYSTYGNYSVGFYWETSATPSALSFTDQFGTTGPGFHICGGSTTTSCGGAAPYANLLFCVENTSGITVGCAPIETSTPYWVTMQVNSGGSDTVAVYSVPSLSLVGMFTTLDSGFSNGYLRMGDVGGETPGIPFSSWYWNIIAEWADAQFPLLPQ